MGGILCKQKLCEVLSFMDILPFFTDIFIIFSFTFVSPFTYSVLGQAKADMI